MGGVIAQWLAATHPGRVLSLTLMSTTAPGRREVGA
jgi:pimeloyl-ACP methyl ester carboxylesterase